MATTHEFASETRTELWKNQHLQLYVYAYFDKFIWMLVNEMPIMGTRRMRNVEKLIAALISRTFK